MSKRSTCLPTLPCDQRQRRRCTDRDDRSAFLYSRLQVVYGHRICRARLKSESLFVYKSSLATRQEAPSTDRRQIPRTNRALHLSSRFGLGHYRDCGVSLEGTSAAHVNVLIMGEDEPSPVKILSSNRIVEDFDVKESDELIQAEPHDKNVLRRKAIPKWRDAVGRPLSFILVTQKSI